jgi:hypothetical protein
LDDVLDLRPGKAHFVCYRLRHVFLGHGLLLSGHQCRAVRCHTPGSTAFWPSMSGHPLSHTRIGRCLSPLLYTLRKYGILLSYFSSCHEIGQCLEVRTGVLNRCCITRLPYSLLQNLRTVTLRPQPQFVV